VADAASLGLAGMLAGYRLSVAVSFRPAPLPRCVGVWGIGPTWRRVFEEGRGNVISLHQRYNASGPEDPPDDEVTLSSRARG
jgi:hypothetical protein